MKYLRMLAFGTTLAVTLMAFVGGSTASATVLCKTAPNAEGRCAEGWAYTGEIHMVSTEKIKLTTTFKTIECDESTIAATPESEGSATSTVKGPVSVLTFTGSCNCTFIVVFKGDFELHAIRDTGNGTFTSNDMTLTKSCSTIFGTVHCNYVTENDDIGTLVGGADPTMNITFNTLREATSAICDEEAVWHAKYTITTPGTLYVATST